LNLTEQQRQILDSPLNTRTFLSETAGCGKTTVGPDDTFPVNKGRNQGKEIGRNSIQSRRQVSDGDQAPISRT